MPANPSKDAGVAGNPVRAGRPHQLVRGSRSPTSMPGEPEKLLWEDEILGHDRFLAQIGLGGLPFSETARSIELLASEILPVIRRETAPSVANT